ncbi:MAG: YajQ family cyclic di-GMP-binding protein [Xanthomonadales bacterium]|nr:YajQ family cyclic di-GMP-binding protein [Xanthomonadales bacterium]
MPSFDVVSEINYHELSNAIDQANREIKTRFDFKGSGANFELQENTITLTAQADFQLQQMNDVLAGKLVKRSIDLKCLDPQEAVIHARTATQKILVKEGIQTEEAKKLVKLIKDSKMKMQTAIQGEQLRITGKKRDDLQAAIALLKNADCEMPLQYKNFRD